MSLSKSLAGLEAEASVPMTGDGSVLSSSLQGTLLADGRKSFTLDL